MEELERQEKIRVFNEIVGNNISLIERMFPSPRYTIEYNDSYEYIGGEKIKLLDYEKLDKYNHPKQYLFGGNVSSLPIEEYEEQIKEKLFYFMLLVKRDKAPIDKRYIEQDKENSIGFFITEQILNDYFYYSDKDCTIFDIRDKLIEKLNYCYTLGRSDAFLDIRNQANEGVVGVEKDRFVRK